MDPRVLQWADVVSERYDLRALSAFVNKTINESHDWHGLDLSTRDAKQWGHNPSACILVGENWTFGAPDPKMDAFILVTSLPQSHSKFKQVTLHCIRHTRDTFELESIEIEVRDFGGDA